MGRVTETAGVRGIDESDLKSASFNQAQYDAMVANRVEATAAAAHAGEQHWEATTVAYATEAKSHKDKEDAKANSSASGSETVNWRKRLFGSMSNKVGSLLGTAEKVTPKSEANSRRKSSRSARRSQAGSSAHGPCGTTRAPSSA